MNPLWWFFWLLGLLASGSSVEFGILVIVVLGFLKIDVGVLFVNQFFYDFTYFWQVHVSAENSHVENVHWPISAIFVNTVVSHFKKWFGFSNEESFQFFFAGKVFPLRVIIKLFAERIPLLNFEFDCLRHRIWVFLGLLDQGVINSFENVCFEAV